MKSSNAISKIKSAVKGVSALTAAAVAVKFLSLLYRIPLTGILGAVGLGIYQSAYPIYALIITVTSGGLTAAVSKCCAEFGAEQSVKAAIVYALVLSVPLSLAAALCSGFIAALSGCRNATAALAVLLPSAPLSAVTAAIRGGFMGSGNVKSSAIGQIVEQTFKIAAGLGLAAACGKYGVAASVAGAAAGVAAGEAAHLLYCVFKFFIWGKRNRGASKNSCEIKPENLNMTAVSGLEAAAEIMPQNMIAAAVSENKIKLDRATFARLIKQIIATALPITLGLAVLPVCRVLDSFTAVNVMTKSGADRQTATALYGVAAGAVNAVINLPSVLTAAINSVLIPKISRLAYNRKSIKKTAALYSALSLCAGCAGAAAIFVAAKPCMAVIAGGCGVNLNTLAKMLKLACLGIPLLTLLQTLAAVLQGGGRAYMAAANLFIAGAVKQAVSLMLIPRLQIYGFITAEIAFYLTAAALDFIAVAVLVKKQNKKIF